MDIGERIKQIRISKGLSQKQLGEKMGVSQQMIGQYENSSSLPKIDTLKKIAQALDIDTIELLNFEGAFFEKVDTGVGEYMIDWNADETRQLMIKDDEYSLINSYRLLNPIGKSKACEQVTMLTKISEYTSMTQRDNIESEEELIKKYPKTKREEAK